MEQRDQAGVSVQHAGGPQRGNTGTYQDSGPVPLSSTSPVAEAEHASAEKILKETSPADKNAQEKERQGQPTGMPRAESQGMGKRTGEGVFKA